MQGTAGAGDPADLQAADTGASPVWSPRVMAEFSDADLMVALSEVEFRKPLRAPSLVERGINMRQEFLLKFCVAYSD